MPDYYTGADVYDITRQYDLYRIPVEDQAEALRRMVKQGGNKDPTD